MRYTAQKLEAGSGHQIVRLRDADSDSQAEVVLSVGSNLNGLILQGESVIENHSDLEELRRRSSEFGSAVLSPPNYLRDGTFDFRGRTYRFPLGSDGHHLHGDIRHLHWRLSELGADVGEGSYATAEFVVADHLQLFDYYPHKLVYRLTYRLKDGKLSVAGTVENSGEEQAPFGLGFHPYFSFGLLDDPDSVRIELPAAEQYKLGPDLCPSGYPQQSELCGCLRQGMPVGKLPTEPPFSLFKLSDGVGTARIARIVRTKARQAIELRWSSEFRFMALFKPSWSHAVSLEPYTCIANAFNSSLDEADRGPIKLNGGEILSYEWSIGLEKID